jgi:hypothetical protein
LEGFDYNIIMYTTIFIVFGVIILFTFILTRISPYESDDFNVISFDINDKKEENIKYIEVEKIVEKPVEVIKEIENTERIKELELRIKELEQIQNNNVTYRNIGLELLQTRDLQKFNELLKEIVGKNIIVVTNSSLVLSINFKGNKIFEGKLIKYDIINDRYPNKPIVRLYINDIHSSYNTSIEWIFDNHKLNQDFSSSKVVSEFMKNRNINHPLLLMEV